MSSTSREDSLPAPSDVDAVGRNALRVLGSRLAALYDATVVIALLVGPWRVPVRTAAAIALVLLHAAVLVAVCRRPRRRIALIVCLASLVAATVSTVGAGPSLGWHPAQLLVANLISGAAAGLALASGLWPGVAAWFVGVGSWLVSLSTYGVAMDVSGLLGVLTTTVVAGTVSLMIRRGFRTTEQSLAAVAEAELARRVAEARWDAQRQQNRVLHDTVLSTLTVLAHRGEGVPAEVLRSACARDAGTVQRGAQHPDGNATAADSAGEDLALARLARRWAGRGLRVDVHEPTEGPDLGSLDAESRSHLIAAVDECLDNVRRHAGVDAAVVVVNIADGSLRCVVVDEGCGFDLQSVAADRLGLLESVHGRMAEVGGTATIWSRPAQGTSVLLRLPVKPISPEEPEQG